MGATLERETAYFNGIREDLEALHRGKFAVVAGEELLGVFDTDEAAYEAGIDAKGNIPMLIRRIGGGGDADRFAAPALYLGLLHGHS